MKKTEFSSDELLPLSGIQHFCFCRRQWALIHVERQWKENVLTVEGKNLHERADDPYFEEVRKGILITRSMPVASYQLGLIGVCDVIEFSPSPEGINLKGRQGKFLPAPIEYKRGKEKWDRSDESQLCAQAMCLEEMLSVTIPAGALFYGATRHRHEVIFSEELRDSVQKITAEMHNYFDRGYTPRVKPSKACRSCSLSEICIPSLLKNNLSASSYIQQHIAGEDT